MNRFKKNLVSILASFIFIGFYSSVANSCELYGEFKGCTDKNIAKKIKEKCEILHSYTSTKGLKGDNLTSIVEANKPFHKCKAEKDKDYSASKTESGKKCEDKEESVKLYTNTMSACDSVPGINEKIRNSKNKYPADYLNECSKVHRECIAVRNKEKKKNKKNRQLSTREMKEIASCEWMDLKAFSEEAKTKLEERVKKEEKELLEKFSKQEVASSKALDDRKKATQEIEQAINDVNRDLALIPTQMQQVESELDGKARSEFNKFQAQLIDMQGELERQQTVEIFAANTTYERKVRAAKNTCIAKAKERYIQERNELLATKASRSSYNVKLKKSTARRNELTALCLEDGISYANDLAEAAEDRAAELKSKQLEIKTLKSKINEMNRQYFKFAEEISNTKNRELTALKQRSASLMQNLNMLQRKMIELGRPDQSQMVKTMQEQQAYIREFQSLDQTKVDVAKIKKSDLKAGDFAYLSAIDFIGETEANSTIENYLICQNKNSVDALKKAKLK